MGTCGEEKSKKETRNLKGEYKKSQKKPDKNKNTSYKNQSNKKDNDKKMHVNTEILKEGDQLNSNEKKEKNYENKNKFELSTKKTEDKYL